MLNVFVPLFFGIQVVTFRSIVYLQLHPQNEANNFCNQKQFNGFENVC